MHLLNSIKACNNLNFQASSFNSLTQYSLKFLHLFDISPTSKTLRDYSPPQPTHPLAHPHRKTSYSIIIIMTFLKLATGLAAVIALAGTNSANAYDGSTDTCPGAFPKTLDEKGFGKLSDLNELEQRVMQPNKDPNFKGGCAKGADFSFLVRKGKISNKFTIEFQGGG
jgi:hypothetical protein